MDTNSYGLLGKIDETTILRLLRLAITIGKSMRLKSRQELRLRFGHRSYFQTGDQEIAKLLEWQKWIQELTSSTYLPASVDTIFNPLLREDLIYNQSGINIEDAIDDAYDLALKAVTRIIREAEADDVTVSVQLIKIDHSLAIQNNKQIKVIHTFTADSELEDLFSVIYSRTNRVISAGELRLNSRGYGVINISEALRSCGISSKLKQLFFPICSKSEVMFVPTVMVTKHQRNDLFTGLKPVSK